MRVLTALDRALAGRDPLPTAAVMDAQAARSGTVALGYFVLANAMLLVRRLAREL